MLVLLLYTGLSVHHFAPDWSMSTTIGCIAKKLCADIQSLATMEPTDFGDPWQQVDSEMSQQPLDKSP